MIRAGVSVWWPS